ncbi:MAG: hypothetical protein RIT27_1427 [Pseudomonadota bacterium]|jgi:hypothetical protein
MLKELANRLINHDIVPYLGAGALADVVEVGTQNPIPADSDSLILALTGGKLLSPRLMYEFPRAAMDQELKRGRSAVNKALNAVYAGNRQWTRGALHDWLAEIKPPYVIDINRDLQLQTSYSNTPHLLIRGIARIAGTQYRFKLDYFNGEHYENVTPETAPSNVPFLFKPMGSPLPDAVYIASDADYVDYITELMGGFGIPSFLKTYRKQRQYLFLGLRMNRDTERMVLSDIIYDAATPAGWALIPDPTPKERRFCATKNLEIIEADIADLLAYKTV